MHHHNSCYSTLISGAYEQLSARSGACSSASERCQGSNSAAQQSHRFSIKGPKRRRLEASWSSAFTHRFCADNQSYELEAILDGHGAYVNALAYIPADEAGIGECVQSKRLLMPDYLASSGNSTLILLHSLSSTSPDAVHALVGHALNVCTLAYSSSYRRLISGSWDLTARVWSCDRGDNKGWGSELVLEGHEAAVWGVAVVDAGPRRGCYLTGSGETGISRG